MKGIWTESEGIWEDFERIWKKDGIWRNLEGIWENEFEGIWKDFERFGRNLWECEGILRNLGAARQGRGRHLFALKRRLSGVSHRSAPHHPATRPVPPAWPTTMASCFGLVIPSLLTSRTLGRQKPLDSKPFERHFRNSQRNFALAFQYGMCWGSQSVVMPPKAPD